MADMTRFMAAWDQEPATHDEQRHTPHGRPGYQAWNGKSPELEFCELAGALTTMLHPQCAIETGVGQGFVTRRIAAALTNDAHFLVYEAWEDLRSALIERNIPSVTVMPTPTPTADDMADADLVVLDSARASRFDEMQLWWDKGKPNSIILVHDTGYGHTEGTDHVIYAGVLRDLGVQGIWFPNPRGSFVGQHP